MSAMEVEPPSDFSNDLLLLDRVFLRIGNADTDEQLENCLNKFLPPVILKLSSPNEQVRTKVMELLVHVNKRVRCRSEVQLPVRTLLQQYKDPNATNFVVNFAIIYITMGFPRLPRDQQVELVPEVLNAITNRPQSHQDGILILLMPLLGEVDAKNLNLKENVVLSRLVVRFATDILLLPYRALPGNSSEGTEFQVPPGMSLRSYKRITAKNVFTAAQLEEMKTSIVKFIEKDVMKDTEVLLPLIVAAADSRFNVANMANSPLARVASSVDWTSSATVAPLYGLYLGLGGGRTATAEDKRAPACTRLRLKLLPYLNRSSGAAVMFPHSIQIIFTSLFDENSNSRLKNLAISYTLIVINGGDLEQLKQVAGVLLEGVLKVIRSAEFHEHHPRAFTCVGRLAMRVPSCVNSQFGILEEFVGKLPEASPELKTGIRDALLDMSHAFKIPHSTKKKEEPMEVVPSASTSKQEERMEVEGSGEESGAAVKDEMEDMTQQLTLIALLDQYLQRDDPMIRYVATRYAASVFPPDSVPSKYLLLLASGDSKDDVSTEALKALYGVTRPSEIEDVVNNVSNREQGSDAANVAIPCFTELVEHLWEQMERRKRGSNAKHRFVIQNHVLPFHPVTYNEMVRYMRASLVRVAGLKDCSAHPCSQTPLLTRYVRESLVDRPALKHYVSMLTSLMVAVPDVMPLTGLLDIVGCVPDKMAAEYAAHLPFFRNLFTTSTKEEVRDVSASLYATVLVWSSASSQRILSEASELAGQSKTDTSLESRCGLVSAAARMVEGCLRRHGEEVGDKGHVTTVVVELANMLSSGNNLLVGTACSNLALLARCTGLPIPDSSPAEGSPDVSKQALLTQLFEVVTNAKFSSKTKEKALSTLGLLCVGERFPYAKKIVQGFLDMAKDTKEFEIHLAIGESLVLCVEGVESDERRDAWREAPRPREKGAAPRDLDVRRENDALLEWLLQELLKVAGSPHPNSKQATSIWLLAVTRGCCDREPVKSKLNVIQEAFMDFLSENSDIVQDVASKGLSVVYTASEESEKQQLVGQLVEQLAGGRRRVQQVAPETRVFEEGQLGQSPTGGNLSTYKELCSLASDLNQPDLLYKFMHLAHHNSMWNSKKGAAFGFQSISTQAGAQLAQYLPKIVPRLYRYRFDPTPRIQNSMSSIWQALVTDTHQTVEKYHSEILDDLVVNLTSAQWRVRMSCCHAVADLMRSVPGMDRWRSRLAELWKQLFRVMDDVHEGTRLAANTTAAMLSKMCIRAVEEGKSGNDVLAAILPVLLDTGITHLVKEVRNISLTTVSGVVDDPQVRPWLPRLIPALLTAAGDLEPAALAQLSTTLGASSDARAAVDTARASLAKQHVTTRTVTRAVPYLDAAALKELAPAVLDLTRSPQLGCRAAAAYFWQVCAAQVRSEFSGLAPRAATALLTAARDRNAAARSVAAAALPHVVACAKPSSVDKLVERIVSWYEECESQNENPEAIALVLRALASHDAELLRQRAVRIAPLVFLAMHAPPGDQDAEKTAEIFAEVWSEISPGRETMLRTHLSAVSQDLQTALGSRNRTTKLQAAEAVKTLCSRLGSAVDPERTALLAALKPAVTGPLYPGKHCMLYAIAALTNVKASETPVDPAFVEECARIVLGECTRKDPAHSRHALLALAEIPLPPAIFTGLYDIVKDILAKEESAISKDSDDEDGSETSGKRDQLRQLKEAAYQLLGQAWPEDPQTQKEYGVMVLSECVSRYESNTRSTRIAMLAAAQRILRRGLITADSAPVAERVTALLDTAFRCSTEARLRSSALTIMHYTAVQLKELSKSSELDALRAVLERHLPELSRGLLTAPEVSCRLDQVKEALR